MKWGTFISIAALAVASVSAAQPKPAAFKYAYKNKYAKVDFTWSSEVAAIPALARRFRAELAKAKRDTIAGGKQDYGVRQIGWESWTKITTSGQTSRLLSLSREDWDFTGGAHGNGGTTGLLWDRRLHKEVSFASLFSTPSSYVALMRASYCRALDKERIKRRGGDGKLNFTDFDSCPKLSDLAIIPADSKPGDPFNQVHLVASPYLAGPYAEGEYDIALPVTSKLIASMKPQYRSSFEVQRQ